MFIGCSGDAVFFHGIKKRRKKRRKERKKRSNRLGRLYSKNYPRGKKKEENRKNYYYYYNNNNNNGDNIWPYLCLLMDQSV